MSDALLLRKLIAVIALKLAAIGGLWWWFVQDERPTVTTDRVAEHMTRSSPASTQGKTNGH